MTSYNAKSLAILKESFATTRSKKIDLFQSYLELKLKNQKANEFCKHGLLRRISVLTEAIETIFETLPPDFKGVPEKKTLNLVTICLQATATNLFGVLDNIGTIWVNEFGIKKSDGGDLPRTWVGIRPKNKVVRKSFSDDFQKFLRTMDPWMKYLDYFRHSLAHRIPLYIPPYSVSDKDEKRYHELNGMLWLEFDLEKRAKLQAELEALKLFQPVMLQSWERPKLVLFHGQILNDFLTIEEICKEFLVEIDRRRLAKQA